jgi:hypothetical protein
MASIPVLQATPADTFTTIKTVPTSSLMILGRRCAAVLLAASTELTLLVGLTASLFALKTEGAASPLPQAIEVGPRTDKEGPGLVLFRGVGCPPALLNAWLEATVLRASVGRVLWLSKDEACQAGSQQASAQEAL